MNLLYNIRAENDYIFINTKYKYDMHRNVV